MQWKILRKKKEKNKAPEKRYTLIWTFGQFGLKFQFFLNASNV